MKNQKNPAHIRRHQKTFDQFIMASKWAVIVIAVILALMAIFLV